MINKDNFNSDNYKNRLIIFFETYDNNLLYQSEVQRVQTANLTNYFNKKYENNFWEYGSILSKFGVTVDNFDVTKFSNKVWISDFDLPREYNITDVINGIDFDYSNFIINPVEGELSDLLLDNEQENLIYNLINYKEVNKEVGSFRFTTEGEVNQEETRVIDLISNQEPKKQLDHVNRQLLIQKNDEVINSILDTLPEIKLLTSDDIQQINNNLSHFKKEVGKFTKSLDKFKTNLESVKSSVEDVDWNKIKSDFDKLKKTDVELKSIKAKLNSKIDGVSDFELIEKIKPVFDNAKLIEKKSKK